MTIRDFKSNLANLINKSELPIDVVELVLEKFLADARIIADEAYRKEAEKNNNDAELEDTQDSDS